MNNHDTIVAQVTTPGCSSVGILRISGVKCSDVSKVLFNKLPQPRYANYLSFKDIDGFTVDKGIVLWFPKPKSFTGEDVLELHTHGSQVILDILLRHILAIPGIRIANPGEFSERAFLNNKIDLIQAEGIADLINASSERAARSAINSLQGIFSSHINRLVKKITDLRVQIEASIDFSDENIDFFSDIDIINHINDIINDLETVCTRAQQGNILREGIRVVITGRPNAGKSSLFNALAGHSAAIVTNIEGTTRDLIHENINIDGIPLHIIDTAGLHNAKNEVERIGIELAWKEIKKADQILIVVDGTTTTAVHPADIWPDLIHQFPNNIPITIIRNKSDITGDKSSNININGYHVICLSAYTGNGIDILRDHLKQNFQPSYTIESTFLARHRHLKALKEATNHLKKIKKNLIYTGNEELIAEELRLAQQSLNFITGKFSSDDLLSKIFSSFCIGK